jgi:hypothetical protein
MDNERKPLQFEEFAARLDAIFDQIEANGKEITVERGGRLFALRPKRRRHPRKGGPITADDPLWDIVGIGRSRGPTDVSSNKHKNIADAVASHFESPAETLAQSQLPQESTDVPAGDAPSSPTKQ